MYSLESPHRGDSNEYTQHTFIVQKIDKTSQNYRHLLPINLQWLELPMSWIIFHNPKDVRATEGRLYIQIERISATLSTIYNLNRQSNEIVQILKKMYSKTVTLSTLNLCNGHLHIWIWKRPLSRIGMQDENHPRIANRKYPDKTAPLCTLMHKSWALFSGHAYFKGNGYIFTGRSFENGFSFKGMDLLPFKQILNF